MATSADTVRRYYCHRCDKEMPLRAPSSLDEDVVCPLCNSGFIEELPDRNPNPNPFRSFDLRHPNDLSEFLGATSPPFAIAGSDSFDPFAFLHSHLQSLLTGGASIQIVVDRSGGAGAGMGMGMGMAMGPGMGGSMGDYFFGSGLEQLIQQLAENDPNRYGSPPAAKSAVAALPDVTITADHLKTDSASSVQCSVCMDNFEPGIMAKQLPCKHLFHKECILPWLELHSSCPVCRHELPTDEESRQRSTGGGAVVGLGGGGVGGSGGGGVASPGGRVVERRFRVSLPFWPFGRSSQGEGSGGGGGGGGGGTGSQGGGGNSMDDLD